MISSSIAYVKILFILYITKQLNKLFREHDREEIKNI